MCVLAVEYYAYSTFLPQAMSSATSPNCFGFYLLNFLKNMVCEYSVHLRLLDILNTQKHIRTRNSDSGRYCCF